MNLAFVEHLDNARDRAGFPFRIISGYRTSEYNKKVGGVADSAHTKGLAADIAVPEGKMPAMIKALLDTGFTRIGVGSNIVHVDGDKSKPQNVAWKYTANGRQKIAFPPVV